MIPGCILGPTTVMRRLPLAAILLLLARPAMAHAPAAAGVPAAASPPWVFLLALGLLAAYLAGALRHRGPGRAGLGAARLCAGLTGWSAAALVTGWRPLAELTGASLAGHMAQHMALILLVPPLLVLGRPGLAFARLAPRSARAASPVLNAGWTRRRPATVALLHAAAIWLWHLPGPFAAAEASPALHALEHVTLTLTGYLFWRTMLEPARRTSTRPAAAAMLGGLILIMATGFLGAILTLAPTPLYPGRPNLADQQLAGILMWVPCGLAYTGMTLAVLAGWLSRLAAGPAVGSSPRSPNPS